MDRRKFLAIGVGAAFGGMVDPKLLAGLGSPAAIPGVPSVVSISASFSYISNWSYHVSGFCPVYSFHPHYASICTYGMTYNPNA